MNDDPIITTYKLEQDTWLKVKNVVMYSSHTLHLQEGRSHKIQSYHMLACSHILLMHLLEVYAEMPITFPSVFQGR